MITKRVLVVFALVAGFGWFVYGGGVYEEDVPMPEVQYDLPQAIVGEFTIIAPVDEFSITIYPNNKYILFIRGYDTTGSFHYGHIVEKDGVYYFKPIGSTRREEFDGLTEMYISETGFSFYLKNDLYLANFLFRAIRTPKPEQIAESVTIPRTRTKRQYYVIDRQNRRVPLYTEGSTLQPYEFAYSLAIEKGSVSLYDQIKTTSGYSSMAITWRGFLISTGNDKGDFSGTIQFTNTPAFFNTVDGRVTIEKSGDTITITGVSTEYIEEELRKFYSIEPPVHLVLEF